MVREFHLRAAEYLRDQPDADPQRVLYHGKLAGKRFQEDLPEVVVAAAEQDVSRSVFHRVDDMLELLSARDVQQMPSLLRRRYDIARARYLRAQGDSEAQRMETIRLFDAHVFEAQSPDEEYALVRDLLDAMYESKGGAIAHRGGEPMRCVAQSQRVAQQPHADLYWILPRACELP